MPDQQSSRNFTKSTEESSQSESYEKTRRRLRWQIKYRVIENSTKDFQNGKMSHYSIARWNIQKLQFSRANLSHYSRFIGLSADNGVMSVSELKQCQCRREKMKGNIPRRVARDSFWHGFCSCCCNLASMWHNSTQSQFRAAFVRL